MDKFGYMEKYGYEQLVFFHDKTTGLKGVTCIHDTTLGPALGGTRLWNYADEEDAVEDVLRLARGMTYKSACAGLNLGGGKTVLIGDAKEIKKDKIRVEGYFRALGRYVESLNGRYITAEDVNTTTADMLYVAEETNHVAGLPGKSGNPSPYTAWGVFAGVKASLKEAFGSDSVKDRTFAVQGAGQTGYYLIKYLLGEDFLSETYKKEKAKKIYFTEINKDYIERMALEHPEVEFVESDDIYDLDVDVFSPCALGAVINKNTINNIKAKVVAGSANNILSENELGKKLKDKNILLAPDYVINAGGIINVYHERKVYEEKKALADIEKIYGRLLEMYKDSKESNISINEAADRYAERRIAMMQGVKNNLLNK